MSENNTNLPTKEEVLNSEDMLLRGLMEAGNFKNDEEYRREIKITRSGRTLFSFTVRPLDEEEEIRCFRTATPQLPNPNGKNWPKIDGKTDTAKMRSLKIYTATIDEDKKRIWDNPEFKKKLGVITATEMIDKCLRTGDKDAVLAIIDEISGNGNGNSSIEEGTEDAPSLEEYAKN